MPTDTGTVSFEHVENVVFDLDGTVWNWEELLPGVQETIQSLQRNGKDVYFCTNNTVLPREKLAAKLTAMGVDTEPEHVLSAGYAAAKTFANLDIRTVYVIGETGLLQEMDRFDIKNKQDAAHILVSLDRNINYWKLWRATRQIDDGARFWATGTGNIFPVGDKRLPGEKSIIDAVKAVTNEDYEVIGKPSEYMENVLKDEWSLAPYETLFIGDHAQSDVAFGKQCGFKTGLVLTGITTEEQVQQFQEEQYRPDVVFREFRRILRKM